MKVAQLLPELNFGGVERGTIDLANFLVSQGLEKLKNWQDLLFHVQHLQNLILEVIEQLSSIRTLVMLLDQVSRNLIQQHH